MQAINNLKISYKNSYMTTKPFFFDNTNTYCISLESHVERWTNMQRRFSKMDLEVTRFIACTELDSSLNFAHYLNIGQKLCAQSHVKLLQHILTTNCPYAMILEDDAVFDCKWREKLLELDLDKIEGWDSILLNASEPDTKLFTWVKANNQYLTGAYIISRQGIFALLEEFSDDYCASDFMMVQLQKRSNCYTYYPWICIQEGKDSTIGSGVDLDHKKVVRCLKEIEYSLLDNYIF